MTGEQWERIARANIHPIQLHIIERAMDGERFSPKDIADERGQSLSLVSYHVRVLLKKGLLVAAGTSPRRGAVKHYYKGVIINGS